MTRSGPRLFPTALRETYRESGSDTMDLTGAEWRKSSYSGGNCVEVPHNLPGIVAVRDSKDPDGPKLVFTPGEWDAFVSAVRDGGEFDLT